MVGKKKFPYTEAGKKAAAAASSAPIEGGDALNPKEASRRRFRSPVENTGPKTKAVRGRRKASYTPPAETLVPAWKKREARRDRMAEKRRRR
tara:strand:- start:301 stop:576 length:276 start_codon:yes stop_codon:yes gene_type:complete